MANARTRRARIFSVTASLLAVVASISDADGANPPPATQGRTKAPVSARKAEFQHVERFLFARDRDVARRRVRRRLGGRDEVEANTGSSEARHPSPLRIHAEYQLEGLDPGRRSLLEDLVVPAAIQLLSQRLLVREPVEGRLLLGRDCSMAVPDVWGTEDGYGSSGNINVDNLLECDPSSKKRLCSDAETGVYHNPDLLGPWEGSEGGYGANNADTVLYVTSKEVEDCAQGNMIAYAGACEMDPRTSRPTAGYINVCPSSLNPLITENPDSSEGLDSEEAREMQLDQLLEVVVHEVIHVLFFSDNLYRLFIDPQTNTHIPLSEVVREIEPSPSGQSGIMGRPRHLIVLPQVAAAAQSHFSCPFVIGAELSNDELPPGNHWEQRVFLGDIMDSTTQIRVPGSRAVISNMTLAMAEGSGWYLRNPESPIPLLPFGNGAGCDIGGSTTCTDQATRGGGEGGGGGGAAGESITGSSSMYCSLMGSDGCDATGVVKGRCVVDSTMDGCMVVMPLRGSDDCRRAADENQDAVDMAAGPTDLGTSLSDIVVSTQYQGPGGRCISMAGDGAPSSSGSSSTATPPSRAVCQRMSCTNDGALRVHIGNGIHLCPTGAMLQVVTTAGKETVLGPCPDNLKTCSGLACKGDCSARGRCEGSPGECRCFLGWTGEACEHRIPALTSWEHYGASAAPRDRDSAAASQGGYRLIVRTGVGAAPWQQQSLRDCVWIAVDVLAWITLQCMLVMALGWL